ncbi:MAG: hypothetical protein ACLP9L_01435 [Thermoguttaceae bacterium]
MGEAKLKPMFDATPPDPFPEERKKRIGGLSVRHFQCPFEARQKELRTRPSPGLPAVLLGRYNRGRGGVEPNPHGQIGLKVAGT